MCARLCVWTCRSVYMHARLSLLGHRECASTCKSIKVNVIYCVHVRVHVCVCALSVCVGVSEYVPVCAWAWTWDCLGKRTSLHSWGMYMWTQIACANVTCALRAHVLVDMCIVFVDVFSTCVYRNEYARMCECDLCFAHECL